MNEKLFCEELLIRKKTKRLPSNPPVRLILIGLLSIPILASGSSEIIPFGTLFLGIAVGGFAMEVKWKRNAERNWQSMVNVLDWGKIESIAKAKAEDQN